MRKDTVFTKIPCLDTHMGPQGPMVIITCKKCGYKNNHKLKRLGEAPNIHLEKFKREGWKIKGDGKRAVCPNCLEAAKIRDAQQTPEPVNGHKTNGHAHPAPTPVIEAMADQFQKGLQEQEVVLGLDDAYAQLRSKVRRSTFVQWLEEGKVEGAYQKEGHWWIPEPEVQRILKGVHAPLPGQRREALFPQAPQAAEEEEVEEPSLLAVADLARELEDYTTRASIYRYMERNQIARKYDANGRVSVTPEVAREIEHYFEEQYVAGEEPQPKEPAAVERNPSKELTRIEKKALVERVLRAGQSERQALLEPVGLRPESFSNWVMYYLCGYYGKVDVLPDAYGYGARKGARRRWSKTATELLEKGPQRSFSDRFKEDLVRLMQPRNARQQKALLDSIYIHDYLYRRWEKKFLPALDLDKNPPGPVPGPKASAMPRQKAPARKDTAMQAPDLRKQHNLFNLLDAHYQKDKKRYAQGWNDARCAEEVEVPVEYVVQVREEVYGPIESEFDKLRTEFHEDFAGLMELVNEFQQKWDKRLQALERRS